MARTYRAHLGVGNRRTGGQGAGEHRHDHLGLGGYRWSLKADVWFTYSVLRTLTSIVLTRTNSRTDVQVCSRILYS